MTERLAFLMNLHELNALAAARGLVSGGGRPLRFVAPPDDGVNYELRIRDSGAVATRPGSTHDLLNARAWLDFPQAKAALNRRHCEELEKQPGAQRSRLRDALTLFDESGMVVLCADPALALLLRDFQWKELFWGQRAAVRRSMRFLVFGHALAEKLLAPFKGITARALILVAGVDRVDAEGARQLAFADAQAAAWLARPDALVSTRELAPLPVLGIPGWTPDNENPAYYDDTTQFRTGRR